jgi:hypothetical protein
MNFTVIDCSVRQLALLEALLSPGERLNVRSGKSSNQRQTKVRLSNKGYEEVSHCRVYAMVYLVGVRYPYYSEARISLRDAKCHAK